MTAIENSGDEVVARELDIVPIEERLGVVSVLAVVYRRGAAVFMTSEDGFQIVGRAAAWPDQDFNADYFVFKARGNAHRKLRNSRAGRAEYCARRTEAAAGWDAARPAPVASELAAAE